MTAQNRFRGCLLGLATGDALGTTVEFRPRGSFEPLTDMVGGGPFGLGPGQWTDDTSMALCLAESLVQVGGFDARDQMERYVRWWTEGHLSSTDRCFDIGSTVSDALQRFRHSGDPWSGSTDPFSACNGSIMDLPRSPCSSSETRRRPCFAPARAPAQRMAPRNVWTHAASSGYSSTAHFPGWTKEEILAPGPSLPGGPLAPRIQEIADGAYFRKSDSEIRG